MNETRSRERIAAHYFVERELAARLRNSTQQSRPGLYPEVYDELFTKIDDHPLLTKAISPAERATQIERQLVFLGRYLHHEDSFLEIGAGDCALSLAVARFARDVVAVDVSQKITVRDNCPRNFRLYISSGTQLGVADGAMSLAYSDQLIEHLHPEDAAEHVRNVWRALAKDGKYICITPNRLTGPHDVSRSFDRVATGLHLREYSAAELKQLLLENGFSQVEWFMMLRGRSLRVPMIIVVMAERCLGLLPWPIRVSLGSAFPLRNLLGGIAVATK